jgi:hypothetical protein
MSELSVSDAARVTTLTASDLPAELFDVSPSDIDVQFQISKNALAFLAPYKPRIVAAGPGDEVTISVQFADLSAVPGFVMQLPGAMRVVSPPEAHDLIISWVKRSLATSTP